MAATPMMKQYQEAKAACPDALLLFRMGDFYELFHEDAKQAHRLLGITLTSRDKSANPIPMAGFPHHQLDGYLAKLISAGCRVAVCDQVEDPKKAKGLVRREVTRVVTPGTLTDDALLDPRANNYLAAIMPGPRAGLAWIDFSTGRFYASTCSSERLADELARIAPAEILISESGEPLPDAVRGERTFTQRPPWTFSEVAAREVLEKHFATASLEGFGLDDSDEPAIRAAGAVLDYLQETQKSELAHIDRLIPFRDGEVVQIDESTRRSLEISQTLRDGRREGSLLAVIDHNVTAMGSRMLADWVASPLTAVPEIEARQDAVEELLGDVSLSERLRESLRGIYDMERLLARATTGRASPRDLCFVGRTLALLPNIKAKLADRTSPLLNQLENELDLCTDVREQLEAAFEDDCPLSSREGGFIRSSYHEKLDELRDLSRGGKQWIAAYQADEVQRSGIPSLKIGYNKVFGYFLEVTHTHRDKVPDHYIRKQTLKNAERYITPDLKEHEEKVITADEESKSLEYDLFIELRELVASAARRLRGTADVLARLDTLTGLAQLARTRGYCRPKVDNSGELRIVDGRHPVLDIIEPSGSFVPNDTQMDTADRTILLITGPNMAGKSTYIRQVALITLMAQVGSFVPAENATIGVADRIFARVGASDELSRGQSTFMVEMLETARILNTATPRSLVILDEIGRGTSTYDGVSLAWSVVEFIHDAIGCRTLFATHYHELTDLENVLAGVKNLNVAVREWKDDLVFLHQIVEGAADKSYGIHVARLAGVPREVNERAKTILARLENEHLDGEGRPKIAEHSSGSGELQLTLFGQTEHPLLDEIRTAEINALTPIEALQLVHTWQTKLVADKQAKPR
ncbi:MAG: DNA mismatch repair protein MutS [Pirellulales bacterium]